MSPGYLTYFPSVSIDNVVVVYKPVCVDFPSIVMSRFTRTIGVPFFEFFYQNPTLNISQVGTIS